MFNVEYFKEISDQLKEESKNENCSNCKFVKPENSYYMCRRNPPQVSQTDLGNGRLKFGLFPSVDKHCWCGEYRRQFNVKE